MQDKSNPHQRRLNLLFTMVFLALTTLILRLSLIQIVQGEQYRSTAELHRTVEETIPAPRGLIYDRNFNLLVTNKPSFSVVYNVLGDGSQDEKKIAAELAPYLKQSNETEAQAVDRLVKIMEDPNLYLSTPRTLADHVDQKTIAFVMEHLEDLPGVKIESIPQRDYVNNTLAGHVLGHLQIMPEKEWPNYKDKGYQQNDKIGVYGLEKQYESVLKGKDGTETVEVNRNYEPITSYQSTAPVRGHDLVLNIDTPLQKVLDQTLTAQVKQLILNHEFASSDPRLQHAAAVAIDPNTGDVLAMASYPEFDPNAWVSGHISENDYKTYALAEMNHALQAPYEPGSTVKPLTVMMGLHEGVITPDYTINDTGYLWVGNTRLNNWLPYGTGPVNAVRGLAMSNNPFMANVTLRLGGWPTNKNINDWLNNDLMNTLNKIRHYHQQMGLGVSTGIDLPEESLGDWNQEKNLFTLAEVGIGQNMTYNTAQLAQYTGMLANRGNRMELHVVHSILEENPDAKPGEPSEKVVQTFGPKILNKMPFTQDELNVVWQGMWNVCNTPEGTAYSVFHGPILGGDAPYTVRGKTGTAQITDNIENDLFIGFMPADHPTIAIAVVIPRVQAGLHSYQTVGPIARKLFDEWWNETKGQQLPYSTIPTVAPDKAASSGSTNASGTNTPGTNAPGTNTPGINTSGTSPAGSNTPSSPTGTTAPASSAPSTSNKGQSVSGSTYSH